MKYEVVCWPESQNLMEKTGFYENCRLINSEKGLDVFGPSAYLVNPEWYQKFINDELEDITEEETLEWEGENICVYDDDEIFG